MPVNHCRRHSVSTLPTNYAVFHLDRATTDLPGNDDSVRSSVTDRPVADDMSDLTGNPWSGSKGNPFIFHATSDCQCAARY
jgi:hypothetical protein